MMATRTKLITLTIIIMMTITVTKMTTTMTRMIKTITVMMTMAIIITMKTIMMTVTSIMRVILGCYLSVASSQPITSRIYQRLLYLLTNQIAQQRF